ncbi:MAG: hypothetical protein LBR69_07150 [Endomicrobium sp.]|jgi:flavodoxin|nr:hypothetical protein [Endomicrobium sp.]
MLKYALYAVLFLVLAALAAAGFHNTRVHFKNKKEMSRYEGAQIAVQKDLGKVLVVYYSLSGKTKDIAERIKAKTNADIYEIKTKEPMPSGRALYMGVRKQIKTKKYPEIETNFPDFENYDLIFAGSPVWWYTAATPVLAFLEQADFKGKKVVPFSTQGSNEGTFEKDFKANAKNAVTASYQKFNNISPKYNSAVDNKIAEWINGL